MPELSVIMTMYNVERFLREAIESILSQTYHDYEFIIFDDGSTDGSVAIAESYDDPRICLFQSDHIGRGAALNKAVGYAKTDLLAFMDADDISKKTRFEAQIRYLSENPSIGVIGSWVERIDENGKQMRILKYPEYHTGIEYKMTALCSVMFPGSMIRKMIVINANGFDESIIASCDYEMMLRLLPVTQFYNLPKLLYVYRKNSNSISSTHNNFQNSIQLNKGKEYLATMLKQDSSLKEQSIIYRRMGICEYYHGSMQAANKYLFKAIIFGDLSFENFRYLLPSFLGDRLFSLYRSQLRKGN